MKEELLVLWASICSREDLSPLVLPKVSPDFFTNPNIKDIMTFVLNHFNKYNQAPPIEAIELEFGRNEKIIEILDQVKKLDFSERDREWLVDELDRSLRLLALTRSVMSTAERIQKKNIESSVLEKEFKEALSITIKDDDIFRYSDPSIRPEMLKSSGKKFPTFYPTLDEYTDGGLDDPCLFVIQSRSHGGKTAFKLNLAARVAMKGKKCIFFSLEMSEAQIFQRLDSILLSKNIRDIYKPSFIEITNKKIIELLEKSGGDIYIIRRGPRSVSVGDIRGILTDLRRRDVDFDYVFIDYINLIKEKGDLYERGVAIAEGLLDLSFEFHCPIITSVQMQRSSYKKSLKEIDLDSASESMGIPNTASFYIHIGRDPKDPLVQGKIFFKIVKDRIGGSAGKMGSFFFNTKSLKIYDPLEEELFIKEAKELYSIGEENHKGQDDLIGDLKEVLNPQG